MSSNASVRVLARTTSAFSSTSSSGSSRHLPVQNKGLGDCIEYLIGTVALPNKWVVIERAGRRERFGTRGTNDTLSGVLGDSVAAGFSET